MENQRNQEQLSEVGQERVKLSRASVACRRCRRLRTKCIARDGKAPCEGCHRAGSEFANACYFPARGNSHHDRGFRVDKSQKAALQVTRAGYTDDSQTTDDPTSLSSVTINSGIPSPSPSTLAVPLLSVYKATRDVLPPVREVIEGCRVFWTSCFQVGFFSKRLFLERLSQDMEGIPLFLVLGVLSVSCRFTPCLIKRYGSSQAASDYFIRHASSLVLDALYDPSLDNIQGFFMLALAQWGDGDKTRSSIHMGIALRMAGILRLHREETYDLPPDATTDEIVRSEMARRTFWVLETQDNLHSSHASPAPFGPDDITALLPCGESDFSFGRIPVARAAMPGTKAAQQRPELTALPSRSLFATLLQAHSLWGTVARKARPADFCSDGHPPWDERSNFAAMCRTLQEWERGIPENHLWSVWNMRGHSAEQVHLAYLSIVIVTRLTNVVIRRIYLEDMITTITKGLSDGAPPEFWVTVADELFENVQGLLEPINFFMSNRAENEGFSAMLLFSLYVSGTLSLQLLKTPSLCPRLASTAQGNLTRALEMLVEWQNTWPLASRWLVLLRKAAASVHHGNPRTEVARQPSTEPVLNVDLGGEISDTRPSHRSLEMLSEAAATTARRDERNSEEHDVPKHITKSRRMASSGGNELGYELGSDLSFETELTEFLGNGNYGMIDVWVPFENDISWGYAF